MESDPSDTSVLKRIYFLFETGFRSDCSFLVGDELDSKVFTAHRVILGSSSPVFEAMLYGPLAEKGIIKVTDIRPYVFQVLLEFLYTDDATFVDNDHACGVLYAASKYMLPNLTKKCCAYLKRRMVLLESCAMLEVAVSLQVTDLISFCLEKLCKHGDEILNSNDILKLSDRALIALLECDNLQIQDEMVVFAAAHRWAQAMFDNDEDKPKQASELRAILFSSGVFKHIRLLTLNLDTFLKGPESPACSGLLTTSEVLAVVAHIKPKVQTGQLPVLPTGLCENSQPRLIVQTKLQRPIGIHLHRRIVKSSHSLRRVESMSSFLMHLKVTTDVLLQGLLFSTQIPGFERYIGRTTIPSVYQEDLRIRVWYKQGETKELLGGTVFKCNVPYNCTDYIALPKPLHMMKERNYSVSVTLCRPGEYPLGILSRQESYSGVGFRFEDHADIRDDETAKRNLGFIVGIYFSSP